MSEQIQQTQTTATTPVTAPDKRPLVPVADDGQFSNLMDSARFDQLWRVAKAFAASSSPADRTSRGVTAARPGIAPTSSQSKITQRRPRAEG